MVRSFRAVFNGWRPCESKRAATWWGMSRLKISGGLELFFRNFVSIGYSKGFSSSVYLIKLYKERNIKLSRERLKELQGIGRYAGVGYCGFISYEWLYSISDFCGVAFTDMFSHDFSSLVTEDKRKLISKFWAGRGKGSRGVADFTMNMCIEALNYDTKQSKHKGYLSK